MRVLGWILKLVGLMMIVAAGVVLFGLYVAGFRANEVAVAVVMAALGYIFYILGHALVRSSSRDRP